MKSTEAVRRKELGCEERSKTPIATDEDGEQLYRCPSSQVTEQSWFVAKVAGWVESGFLPFEGSMESQPRELMARVELFRYYLKRYLEDEVVKKNKKG